MAGEIEAFGAMATAGLAASTFDTSAPLSAPRHLACANCASPLAGDFCHVCGQSGHVHRSIGHIFEEFLHGIWHFDSKAWRTLPRLVFQPGRLTREYVYGRRAGYIAPLALFLFSIFLMFFVFGMLGGPDVNGALTAADNRGVLAQARSDVDNARGEVTGAIGEITGARADADTTPAGMKALEAALRAKQAALAVASTHLAEVAAQPSGTATAAAPVRTDWKTRLAAAAKNGELNVDTGSKAADNRIREALQNPDFALYRIEQKAYKLSFLLIPMSLPVLWLLFAFRRDVHTYDHVVFALYSLSFMSLLFIVIALAVKIDPAAGRHGTTTNLLGKASGLLFLTAPVHMFAQLKGAYRLGIGGALWRTMILTIACCIILGLFATLIVVVGLAD